MQYDFPVNVCTAVPSSGLLQRHRVKCIPFIYLILHIIRMTELLHDFVAHVFVPITRHCNEILPVYGIK